MQATKFEFEQRLWIIAGIYFVGFALSGLDHTAFTTALRHWLAPSILPGSAETARFSRIAIAIGALLVFLSAALRTWGAAYLRTDVVHDTGQHSESLVADGPFRYTRNPLYFANLPMAAGIGVMASRLGWIFLVLANWLFVYRLIFREEEALRRNQGEAYLAYCRGVPRFWPSLRPRVPAGGATPRWGQAYAGESFIWLFGAAELCLALTSNVRLTSAIFVLGFVVNLIIRSRIRTQNAVR